MFRISRLLSIALVLMFSLASLFGQSLTTGAISGTVKDQSGAVIPGATVTLHSLDSGATQTELTNQNGAYSFSLLQPGNYTVHAALTGLTSETLKVNVLVGSSANVDLVGKVQTTQEVIEVTASEGGGVNLDNANLTTAFSNKQIAELPIPGGDLTTVAFTVPGIAVSTGGGYGNFSSHGLPGTSNLFTINGDDYNDPYLNLNNSGASNLLLGQTEVAEATVTQNGYSVQYGRQAGAQVNYVTKGGTNQIHFDLLFNFNNHIMNANDFFANSEGIARPYAVSKQWGADIGGPILRNKLFFFSDSEGLYYTLPSTATVAVPSPQLQSYILGTVNPASVPLYTQAFGVYNLAIKKGASAVTTGGGPLQDSTGNLGCGGTPDAANGLTGIAAPGGGTFGVDTPCAYAYGASGSNTNKEWLETHRVDWNINDKQKIFFRFKGDHGFQPTGTNLLTPTLNEQSVQPQYEGQINHTYVISPSQVNSFVVSILWYSAIFGPASVTQASNTFPSQFNIGGAGGTNTSGFYRMGDQWDVFPQGRNAGQGQIVDDYSLVKGSHSLKFGVNFRRNRVTDFGYEQGQIGSYLFQNLGDFAAGTTNSNTGSEYLQVFSPLQNAHIRFYNIGVYAQDEWAVKPNLKVTLGLRMDRTANPTCLDRCFSNLVAPFTSSAFQKGADIPYNASIRTGLSHAYNSVDAVVPDPRLGIVWTPRAGNANSTVIRGGIGVFSDLAPGVLVSSIFKNAPFPFTTNIADGSFVGGANAAGSSAAEAQAQYNAFKTGFFGGQTLAGLNNSIQGGFSPFPYFSIPSKFLTPNVIEWSFELQQPIGAKNVLVATYSGNHGYNLLAQTGFPNAFVNTGNFPNGFANLPTSAPDPRFSAITQLTNGGISNYNGLSVQFRRAFGAGFQGEAGYTWSHAMDDVSNGGSGSEPYSGCSGCSFNTLANPILAQNYASSDYDIRHNFTADFVWDTPWKFQNNLVGKILGSWTVSGKFFWRSGTPFSIIDSALPGLIAGTNIASTVNFGVPALTATAVGNLPSSCSASAVNTPCFTAGQFIASGNETTWGNVGRNALHGPNYSDIDATVFKNFSFRERLRFQVGVSAYNLINHPNFQNPNADIASPSSFGTISSTAVPPTSAYGSFQGSNVSGRVLVVSGKVNF